MKPGQEAIYYITGESVEAAAKSPQLEGFAARGVEVLLLADPVDEFWIPAVGAYDAKPLQIGRPGAAAISRRSPLPDDKKKAAEAPQAAGTDALIALLKLTLQDAVKDVRASTRLDTSAVCLVADEGDMDIHLERLLKQHRQMDKAVKRVLEVNPRHPLIAGLAKRLSAGGSAEEVTEAAWLLLDQAAHRPGRAGRRCQRLRPPARCDAAEGDWNPSPSGAESAPSSCARKSAARPRRPRDRPRR